MQVDRSQIAERLATTVGLINRMARPTGDGLTYGQVSALASIVRKGPIRPGDLARLEAITAPSATRLISGLESAGFIERTPDPADGRAFFIEATPSGIAALTIARQERAQLVGALLEQCSDDQLKTIAATLALFESALDLEATKHR